MKSIIRRSVPPGPTNTALARRGRRWQSTQTTTSPEPLKSILIANRGEIALRVGRTASQYGIRTTTLYTDPDRLSQHALSSPFAVNLGSTDQYLNGSRIIQVARENGCQAIHPGYGFLSENAAFAKACTDAGIKFIGPPHTAIEAMGDKSRSKEIMIEAGVPCIPGYHGAGQDPKRLEQEAEKMGYPVLLKAVKGGGGKGMRIVMKADEFQSQLESAKSEARSSFGDDVMLVEKYITTPRHIEVQVFADKHGNCVALGERDCSIQRRHQKILEESPAPNLAEDVRQDLWEKARQAALAVGYEGAGTVEFIFDNDTGEFFFMEMNTRLQVEHPVTEMVTGEDLVRWQIIVAEGGKLPLTQDEVHEQIKTRGHAIEARIYAEDPTMNFIPSTGKLLHLRTPVETESVRIDAGFVQGDEVSSHYDPMIAKLIVSGPDRTAALQKMVTALEEYEVAGPTTNIDFVKRVCQSPDFIAGDVETGYISKHHDKLFAKEDITNEVWTQAAIGLYEAEQARRHAPNAPVQPQQTVGFGNAPQPREFHLVETSTDPQKTNKPVHVRVLKTAADTYQITINDETFTATSSYHLDTNIITSFFPHTRMSTTLIRDPETNHLTLFQQGRQYNIHLALPKWAEKALGMKDVANSVLAPMPCKVLRVEVNEGDKVTKNQPLIVIESMKMETVIRSPQDGIVSKVVHRQGDVVKAGTSLIEFEGGDEVEG
ncbi:Methylcrotonoyl-CoA carboxylase subunit alpha, mitochondrial [Fulvia fulva]|uniref:Methylcrotonoyl-CoA carboxylase subunit alpha, mitochondrial n=1 Tax=Passalora fulva TaxID=5499 RepID=A0A9Q8LIS8_PASFU|nr:Methylcrotonoyl-CoA carboxylase subunit alpha, mitochondrial [Fulvia fulva]KAK4624609.1 Methylcrotonoyl-CoA carboxylase subunit alpha, mitochondrial [Fulvia fulva]KAK4625397.1 Methylcrotonoyl-CoA carboxylase subunit alpha, mitochondrial [Fulvia fulva]UJO18177.1 Methylcrotonoyl-CoA carboxylase subunit alpha, mitochondrial [Fulvia fulva]WPV15496.1 Methylcrotonoyl-CoA carboxylase subunit alpha, mitochondrial [Fulvia fulva]WPV30073.1 Methylcrotonoyl-CoA carboxylase subunit alpha, mitochondrial 